MRIYYAKFVGLPFTYDQVKAANSVKAREYFAKYRDDAVIFEDNVPSVTFPEYQDIKFSRIAVIDYMQIAYAVGKLSTGFDVVYIVGKNDVLSSLQKEFKDVPGIKDANIFTTGTKQSLCVKITEKLIEYMATIMNQDRLDPAFRANFKQITGTQWPLFIYSIQKTKPKEMLALEEKARLETTADF